jgi:hypothetical protein
MVQGGRAAEIVVVEIVVVRFEVGGREAMVVL